MIINAVSLLLSALTSIAVYYIAVLALGLLVTNPILFAALYILINVTFFIMNVFKMNSLADWFSRNIHKAYRWFKFRPRKVNGDFVYYAEFVL